MRVLDAEFPRRERRSDAPSPAEQIRWTAVVKLALENAEGRYYPLKEAAKKFAAAEKAKLMEITADPVRLAVLHRSVNQLEEAIEKRVRRLKTR